MMPFLRLLYYHLIMYHVDRCCEHKPRHLINPLQSLTIMVDALHALHMAHVGH